MLEISILLSSYNGEKYLKEQINFLLTQTYANFETISRDDPSNENSLKLVAV